MEKCTYEKDRALAEIFTCLLIAYDCYKDGGISKTDYEKSKSLYLYDKKIHREFIDYVRTGPEKFLFADPNKTALDVLNELIGAGAINTFEYYTLKERHLLY